MRSSIFSATELEQLGSAAAFSPVSADINVNDPPEVSVLFQENTDIDIDVPGTEKTVELVSRNKVHLRAKIKKAVTHYRGKVEQRSQLPRVLYTVVTKLAVKRVNQLLPPFLETSGGIGYTSIILYVAAVVVCRAIGITFPLVGG